ncbi:MAG: SDR family oxidoreductase [Mycobacterium sp.]
MVTRPRLSKHHRQHRPARCRQHRHEPRRGPNAAFQKSLNSLNRFADPTEVAALVSFLAGPEAGFITGTTVNIDGGLSA